MARKDARPCVSMPAPHLLRPKAEQTVSFYISLSRTQHIKPQKPITMKNISLLFIILFSAALIQAQEVAFEYDDAGNRTNRNIIYLPPETTPNDSTLKTGEIQNLPQSPEQTASTALTETVITETIDAATVNIYPNPTGGKFTVEVTATEGTSYGQLQLLSLTGEEILNIKSPPLRLDADLTGHPPGAYILSITLGGKTRTWKVIKQ